MDAPSTLKPPAVAATMIQNAVSKHRDRYESVFIKAFVRPLLEYIRSPLNMNISHCPGGSTELTKTDPGLIKVLAAFTFPVGLVMIVLTGTELLTSNMMVMPMAALKGAIPWWGVFVNWLLVTFGNLAGSLFLGAILVKYSGIVSAEPYHTSIRTFAIHKAADPQWHQIFLRGIGCNWLVCVAVWQAAAARETISKIFAIWIPIWVFVACGFDHVVANMFSVPLGMMFGADITVGQYIGKSFIASYLGNIVGALLVGLPALYFYLRDTDHVNILNEAERGHVMHQTPRATSGQSLRDASSDNMTENGMKR
ncbi:hypothetical protein PM082_000996 [Marasmius tenuissimus]|nr:hypothetical protein PM082_000996 [Marasmius tenuissimus]